ncbi:MAG: TIGR03084 family protein [Acidimicrobiaceae bacterium]|nr:TIGR03084 family protein [Acidimicrobiaceae bacterium]
MHVHDVAADLAAEQHALDDIVSGLDDARWSTDTPSQGWTVADQIGHLTYFDQAAATAITDPEAFRASMRDLIDDASGDDDTVDDLTLDAYRTLAPTALLDVWRSGRARLADAAATLADDDRVAWYGPSMGSRSFLTARLMEAWAHGQDIVDAVGGHRPPTDRLRHIAQLGVITRAWSYANRRMETPAGEVHIALEAPSGEVWTWGPDDAADTVHGPAEDFCLVVTQRRHLEDTGLKVNGDVVRDWLVRAQAFAGPPTDGPGPGIF